MESTSSSSKHLIAPDHSNKSKIYDLPSEEEFEEISHMQLRHYMLRYMWQCNFVAPVHDILTSGGKVLDIACGTGEWILEMSLSYPKSEFTGIDRLSIFPSAVKPTNANFAKENALTLPYENETFNFLRFSLTIFREKLWKNYLLPEALRVLRPGGYIEWQEFDYNMINKGPCLKIIIDGFIRYFEINKTNILICPYMEGYLKEANFIEIHSFDVKCNLWDGRYGNLAIHDFILSFKRMMPQLCQVIGIDEDEYLNLLSNLEEEMIKFKTSYKVHRFIGKKPI
ncbi:279_t:CDS:2 [Funneliformis geosporum]|nr:279_t:CDS:2 [Funneliformis geosporum]